MKHLMLMLIMTASVAVVIAQTEPYGKVSKADLELKASLMDPAAEAEVIFDTQEAELLLMTNGDIEILLKRHERIKVYNEKGLDRANIKLRYRPRNGMEAITRLEGATYNINASGQVETVKLDKQSIFDKKIDNRYSTQTFTMPGVKAGSVFEFRYTVRRKFFSFEDWDFQRDIPVRYSYCSLDYPQEFLFTPLFQTSMPYTVNKKVTGVREKLMMSMSSLPALRDEPYISSTEDYLQRVSIRANGFNNGVTVIDLASTWPRIIKELMEDEDFGIQLTRNIPLTAELDLALKTVDRPEERMKVVHQYVRSQMTWDQQHSIWALDGVRQAWAKKKGNSGEINLILVNLLKDAGLQAFPILLSTRDHGRVNTAKPGYGQFNTVMAYVKIGDRQYFLDATDPVTPVHLVPSSIQYSEGLVISKISGEKSLSEQDWGWVTIWDDTHRYMHQVNIAGSVASDGIIKGDAFVNSTDYAKISSLRDLRDGQEQFVQNHFARFPQGMKIDGFKAANADKDSLPLEQAFSFSVPVSASGDYQYFSLNLFSGLDKNEFIAVERKSDIFFGTNQRFTINGYFAIPAGYQFEELPKNTRMIMPDTSIVFSRLMQATDNKVQFRITVEYNRPIFTIDEYPEFREFYRKMYAMLNEQIVIKKSQP
jgi:hypothetical protein